MASNKQLVTGVPGLDTLLNGGLDRASLVFVVGAAGAGKTVLASQILFHSLQQGIPGLILTTYSEGNVKLLSHLRSFSFFREEAVGQDLTLLSLPSVVGNDIDGAAAVVMKTIRETGAKLVLLDGFQGMADQLQDTSSLRRLLAAIGIMLNYLDITVLVTLTGSQADELIASTLTTADAVIYLDYATEGWRHQRRLEVRKLRGRAQLPGMHSYAITDDGLAVLPRLEALAPPANASRPSGRLSFGLHALDTLVGGGLTAGSNTLVVGAPGVGKTTLALFWTAASSAEPHATVILSFDERPSELRAKAEVFDLSIDGAIEDGSLKVLYLSPVNLNPDEAAAMLIDALRPTTQRVIIDAFHHLVRVLGERAHDYLAALNRQFYARGISSLVLYDIKAFGGFQFDVAESPLSLIADNIIILQQVAVLGAVRRILAVLKMRFSAFDATIRELVIDEHGVRVLTPPESATGVLDAAAAASGLTSPHSESGSAAASS